MKLLSTHSGHGVGKEFSGFKVQYKYNLAGVMEKVK